MRCACYACCITVLCGAILCMAGRHVALPRRGMHVIYIYMLPACNSVAHTVCRIRHLYGYMYFHSKRKYQYIVTCIKFGGLYIYEIYMIVTYVLLLLLIIIRIY